MTTVQLLHHLQEFDQKIEARDAALQEIASALGETDEIQNARAEVDNLRELLHDQEQRLRELEWNVDDLNTHIAADEQRLYSGQVHSPKELENIQRDLQTRKKRRSELEERELQLMGDLEANQGDLQQAQESLVRLRGEWDVQQRELAEREQQVNAEIAALKEKRAKLTATIEPKDLSLYEELRRSKRGRAVSTVERSTCSGCRIALPLGIVQRARAGRELIYCPSCGRLLYAS